MQKAKPFVRVFCGEHDEEIAGVYAIEGAGLLFVADAAIERTPEQRETKRVQHRKGMDLVRHLIDHPESPVVAHTWCKQGDHAVDVSLSSVKAELRSGKLTVRRSGVLD